MVERAKYLISVPRWWVQISVLAEALVERRKLSALEAREVCHDAILEGSRLTRLEREFAKRH
jgi:hypothetical protein